MRSSTSAMWKASALRLLASACAPRRATPLRAPLARLTRQKEKKRKKTRENFGWVCVWVVTSGRRRNAAAIGVVLRIICLWSDTDVDRSARPAPSRRSLRARVRTRRRATPTTRTRFGVRECLCALVLCLSLCASRPLFQVWLFFRCEPMPMLSGRALTLRVASAARSYFLLSLFSRFLSFSLVPLSPFPSRLFYPIPLSPPSLPRSSPL